MFPSKRRIAATFGWSIAAVSLACSLALCGPEGRLSGTATDPSGAVVPGAVLTLVNTTLQSVFHAASNSVGFYSFPTLPVGHYDLTIKADGFKTERKANLTINAESVLTVNATLKLGERSQVVTITSSAASSEAQVNDVATHLGDLVTGSQMAALPLNGRSYTDLLPIQPGVVPVTTLQPNSVIMAGVTGPLAPSGNLNSGNLSIDGQRESSNGFRVNGIDVREPMDGGTSIVPNLDSIDEFRVMTNNFSAKYGNYNGGLVSVVTRSGSNNFHGNAFEFLRNTVLDARNFFSANRAQFNQNQFGGTLGGPVRRQKAYFFGSYQGTRTTQGVETGLISVPSAQERAGNLSAAASSLSGMVSGTYLAGRLSRKLGYAVSAGEPYYTAGCATSSSCVFPDAVIPQKARSAPATNLLKYIPEANSGADQFSTSAYPETVRDDKGSARVDLNTAWGQLSGYYFLDDYWLDNPYPGEQGGASIPGFDAVSYGRAQLLALSDTKVFGSNLVNEFHAGLLRNANVIGQPRGGLGVSMSLQGFVSGPGTPGIVIQAPQFAGVMNIAFPFFIMGVPITNETQVNNTLYLSDVFSAVLGSHTIRWGAQFHMDQVNEHPNATFNGTFNIDGTETGSPFADFLIGVPSNFTQSSGEPFYLRNRYAGLFGQDSWRAERNLTLNLGLRWDYIMPFWEKYNQIQTIVPGRQSVLYPGAPEGLLVPRDPGIPRTLSPTRDDNFAPRIGMAYAPSFDKGLGRMIFGNGGKSSLRASFGIFYAAFPGLSAGIMYAVPPFGYTYLSPTPPLLATPFINAGDGTVNRDPFPLTFPSHNVSTQNPDSSFDFASVIPVSGDPYFFDRNDVPYTDNYMFSYERQITPDLLLTASYAGNQGHHLLEVISTNPGNPALCLSLSQPSEVAPGTPTCGPFGEDNVYTSNTGQVYRGTRVGLGADYGENTAQKTIGNSDFNALETTLRYVGKRSDFLVGYTYSKSMDQGANLGEQLNPINQELTRAISAYDMRHNFVASYAYHLPLGGLFRRHNRWIDRWTVSGIMRFTTGFPVTLYDDSDNSLLGTLGNGVNNYLLDTPDVRPGPLEINTNPRNGRPEFNTSLFSSEKLGQLGNASRRFFYGPGIEDVDMTLTKRVRLTESKSVEIRLEGFNAFNHAQFDGAGSVDGVINDSHFGEVVSAAAPRLIQLAIKFRY